MHAQCLPCTCTARSYQALVDLIPSTLRRNLRSLSEAPSTLRRNLRSIAVSFFLPCEHNNRKADRIAFLNMVPWQLNGNAPTQAGLAPSNRHNWQNTASGNSKWVGTPLQEQSIAPKCCCHNIIAAARQTCIHCIPKSRYLESNSSITLFVRAEFSSDNSKSHLRHMWWDLYTNYSHRINAH